MSTPHPTTTAATHAAAWYPDPHGAGQRWWDGTAWTHHTTAPASSTAAAAASAEVTVSQQLVADRAPHREAIALGGLGAAAGIGVFLPWIEVYGESVSLSDVSGGPAFAIVAAGSFLAYLGYRAWSTGRMRHSGWACAALVLILMIAGASLPSDDQFAAAGVDAESISYGIGAMFTLFGALGAIWPLVVMWRHQRKLAAIDAATAAAGVVAPVAPVAPAAHTAPVAVPARTAPVVSF